MTSNINPTEHTPIQPKYCQLKGARNDPNDPPRKYETINTVLIRLRASSPSSCILA
ncbi:hypothetical protein DZE38_002254 [Clostridium beijerinckii]|nr:hypothetical protein [Clostridium beijerinckii]